DVDSTIAALPENISAIGPVAVKAVLDKTMPKVTASDFDGIDPAEPLATYTTKFNPRKRSRSFNIGHLADKFKGVTIKPGEKFSFNEISGPRDEKAGFKPAPEYLEHRIITGFGGGSCQVSTTLYNSALLAGFKINERQPHSRVVSYVPFGRDATVNYDSKVDLKFTNTLDHPIVIWPRYNVEEGWLQFDIFGHPDDKKEIEITNSYTRIWRDTSKDEFILDPKLAPGKEVEDDTGTHGIRVQTWRHFIQPDGSKITEKLFYDVIKPVSRVVRYNPGPDGMSVKTVTTSLDEQSEDTGNPEIYF
ncbi:MAG: VanW family protein, partial [bacterium]